MALTFRGRRGHAVSTSRAREQTNPASAGLHRIVVVGGGAAGLGLATRLGDSFGRQGRAKITLVDRSRVHLWKPLLHAVAAGSLDPDDHELDFLAQAHWHHFRFRLGEMVGLDRAAKELCIGAIFDDEGRQVTAIRRIPYDTLVIAVGSVSNDFATKGVAQHAVPLDTPDQARRFNRRLLNACIRADEQEEPIRPGQLHVAIIGAGATGTELAAELHRTLRQVVGHGLSRVDPERDIRIILIEAADRILPALPERISEAVMRLLRDLNVDVRTDARVEQVGPEGVTLVGGVFIASELVVWAAGVKAPEVLRDLDGLEANRLNQLLVTPHLQTTRDPDIFAIGDCAMTPRNGDAAPVPPRAQAAHQQASHMLRQLRRRVDGRPLEPFRYRDFGSLVSLGKHSTVGSLMGFLVGRSFFIEGLFARLMYRSLYKRHEMAVYGTSRAVASTLSRLIARGHGPSVKLH